MADYSLYEKKWKKALKDCERDGLITGLKEIGDRTFTAHERRGWDVVAAYLAGKRIGGQCILANGVVWRMGRARGGHLLDAGDNGSYVLNVTGGYVKGRYQIGAQEIIRRMFGGEEAGNLWSVGAAARRIWRYISDTPDPYPAKQRPAHDADGLYRIAGAAGRAGVVLDGNGDVVAAEEGDCEFEPVGYHDCEPGIYDRAKLLDCKSYYGTMLARIAETGALSLRPSVYGKGASAQVIRGAWLDGERERLREAMAEVWECKALRNSMVGAAMGTYRPLVAYCADKSQPTGVKRLTYCAGPGPFRRLGLIIVRSGQDMCHRQAAEVESVYSTVDSVCTTSGRRAELWERYGFRVETKHTGMAEVCGFGSWAFARGGEWPSDSTMLKATVPYLQGYRDYRPKPRPMPESALYTQWM